MFDASTPPEHAPDGMLAVAGYIGIAGAPGEPDTPHIWTYEEWRRFPKLKKLPIFTRSDPASAHPHADAFNALRALFGLGVPRGSDVGWDLETAVNADYLRAVCQVMHWAGYRVWPYGSASTVFGNPACDGYWVADWTGVPHMHDHAEVRATQWKGGPGLAYDSSVIHWWQFEHHLHAGWSV
jgi:hypothetical protein